MPALPLPSEEEKGRFIELIEAGHDRPTAAFMINHEYTGSMFRRLCNPNSRQYYDPEFAERYARAIETRGPLDPYREFKVRSEFQRPLSLRSNGLTKAMHLTEQQLGEFLEMVSAGTQAAEAARLLSPPTSITQIHRRANKDPEFAQAFEEARQEGYPAYQELLRAEAVRQAFAGDYRALRDQMLMHLQEAKVLTTSRHEIGGIDGGAIRILAERHFHELPPQMLDALIEMVEKRERKALPGGEIIDRP
jgi:hypothetical protein